MFNTRLSLEELRKLPPVDVLEELSQPPYYISKQGIRRAINPFDWEGTIADASDPLASFSKPRGNDTTGSTGR